MNALLVLLAALAVPQDPVLQRPVGVVNDFAGVIDAAAAARIERIIEIVRAGSRGEIAVVTLRDIGGREANDVALRLGRQWGVGANVPVGDRARNAGVVVLIVPKETASDGRGQVAIEVGQGAEGFISDGTAGDIWRATIPDLRRADYSTALEKITYSIAERYAREFGFSLDSVAAPAQTPARRGPRSAAPLLFVAAFIGFMIIAGIAGAATTKGRRYGRRHRGGGMADALPWIILNAVLQSNRGGGRSRGGGGWGGSGGGGFGGFGGGGGFSGGGSHGSW